jgi:ABC-type lipoprotein release transport system permease subunit
VGEEPIAIGVAAGTIAGTIAGMRWAVWVAAQRNHPAVVQREIGALSCITLQTDRLPIRVSFTSSRPTIHDPKAIIHPLGS